MRYSTSKGSRVSKARTHVSSQRARSSTCTTRDQPSPSACSALNPVNSSHAELAYSQDRAGRARHTITGRSVSGLTSERAAGAMPGTPCSKSATWAHGAHALITSGAQRLQAHPAVRSDRARFVGTRFARSSTPSPTHYSQEFVMLSWALAFFIIAIIAAVFGFTGIAAGAAEIAKILFVVFVVLFLVSLVAGLLRRP